MNVVKTDASLSVISLGLRVARGGKLLANYTASNLRLDLMSFESTSLW